MKLEEMKGKTIKSVEVISAEHGRTYTTYTLLTFEDGTKKMIGGGEAFRPEPTLDEAEKAPIYFDADELAKIVKRDYDREREWERQRREQDEREFNLLRARLGK